MPVREIKFEKCHPDAVLPTRAKVGDAGLDLTVIEVLKEDRDFIYYRTGLKVAIPEGYVGLIFARSNITSLLFSLGNAVGVIDSGYRGEIQIRFRKHRHMRHGDYPYGIGDRAAQLIVVPYVMAPAKFVDKLDETERGEGGFGSTGL